MFLLRDVQKSDLIGLKKLAAELNTVNLPDQEEVLEALIEKSVRSFNGKIKEPQQRSYLFVLEDPESRELVGTSLIIAQHGTYESPHIYYRVSGREHYSASIDRHFRHQVLSIGYNYAGPTEIGGLVVDPRYRRSPEKAGRQLSYVRFLFIAMHLSHFRDTVLAELLPPLLSDGRSLLWEAVGKKFTGLTYQEADRLSQQNKEFIKELFPASDIYASLFPERTQRVIGEVGKTTRGVKRMLERIGFKYAERIDPFDGGPHFEAPTEQISLIRHFQSARLLEEEPAASAPISLVGYQPASGRNRFRGVRTPAETDGTRVRISPQAREALKAPLGARLSIIPFD
jgi:arginine N-succinyltransferase